MSALIKAVLFLAGMITLVKAMEKYKARTVILTISLLSIIPGIVGEAYQNTAASGIYAVSYDKEQSRCDYEKIDAHTLEGRCQLTFKNHSRENVRFGLEFSERNKMHSLLNKTENHDIALPAKQRMSIEIINQVDVTSESEHIDRGTGTEVDINIIDNGHLRKL
ncbi:hypothetical protein [Halobacillus sp. A5]|uniref:hypothetical protein n=1 Tax=Halobacillus sp. A5 TaxID=2880263 RepID=UPI0020A67FE1|nr:hypothetical protein [Halobacillus sp. A5]MCP3026385.1 hypothetical protein [Halobacillus sp. A5]